MAVTCDACRRGFSATEPGTLWWLSKNGKVYKARLTHKETVTTCHSGQPLDHPDLFDWDTDENGRIEPARIEHILRTYRWSRDDEAWLRQTFGVAKPPTAKQRAIELEAANRKLSAEVKRLEQLVFSLQVAVDSMVDAQGPDGEQNNSQ